MELSTQVIDSIRQVFAGEDAVMICEGAGIYLPNHRLMVLLDWVTTVDIAPTASYTVVRVSPMYSPLIAIKEVFTAIHCKWVIREPGPSLPCYINKIPSELLLVIVKHARRGNTTDLKTLNGLTRSCTKIMSILRMYREQIIEYFTVPSKLYYRRTHLTQFCGKPHSIGDQPSEIVVFDVCSNNGNGLAQRTETRWHRFGRLHRGDDKPAVIDDNGSQEWYIHGKRHRDDDKPAYITKYSSDWYRNGKRWRANDLPTLVSTDGDKEWRLGYVLHRAGDKPAVIRASGTQKWYKNGKKHRARGRPAVTYADGRPPEYWVKGVQIQR